MNIVKAALGRVFGDIGFGTRRRESSGYRQPVIEIPGAFAAPELCMRPVDGRWDHYVGPKIGQLKVDGFRCLHIDKRMLTMEGATMDCALHCLPGLEEIEAHYRQPMVFDGEYQETGGPDATASAYQKGVGQGVLWLFDAVPLDQWMVNRCTVDVETRLIGLRKALYDVQAGPFVGMLDYFFLADGAAAERKARELWVSGWEGLVTKDVGSFYERRRSPAWQRWKNVLTMDCVLVDVMHRKDGRLAKIIVQPLDAKVPAPITVAVGWSKDEARQLERMMAASANGRVVEISYNQKQGSSEPRHARFSRIRLDKGATA